MYSLAACSVLSYPDDLLGVCQCGEVQLELSNVEIDIYELNVQTELVLLVRLSRLWLRQQEQRHILTLG